MSDATLYDDPSDLEHAVRDRDPESSWEAAAISRRDAQGVRDHVLAIIRERGPISDEGIYAVYRFEGGTRTPQRVRTARAHLTHPGAGERPLITPQGFGRTSTGHRTQLWRIL